MPAESLAICLLRLGRYHALCQQVSPDDAEDCAAEFALHMLEQGFSSAPAASGSPVAPQRKCGSDPSGAVDRSVHGFPAAWLHRCAANYAKNFRRALLRHQRRALPWPELVWSRGSRPDTSTSWEPPAPHVSCEAGLLRAEMREQLVKAIEGLRPVPRSLLLRRELHQESIQSLATLSGRTPHAVEQTLSRARQQLRASLKRQGVTTP